MRRRSRVAKITCGSDGNSSRKSRSDALANDRRDVEDHSLSKYDRVYNYQTKSTTRGESRGSRLGITNAFTFGTWQEPTKGARAAGMLTVNKHYDIIFCHNNGRRCYKRFSHEAAVGYHRGQWERPRYAVNWFAKAFLKKPSAERTGPAAATAAVRAARLVEGGRGGTSFWAYTAKITSLGQGLYLCYIITPRATGRIETAGRVMVVCGAEQRREVEGGKKNGWPKKSFSAAGRSDRGGRMQRHPANE